MGVTVAVVNVLMLADEDGVVLARVPARVVARRGSLRRSLWLPPLLTGRVVSRNLGVAEKRLSLLVDQAGVRQRRQQGLELGEILAPKLPAGQP